MLPQLNFKRVTFIIMKTNHLSDENGDPKNSSIGNYSIHLMQPRADTDLTSGLYHNTKQHTQTGVARTQKQVNTLILHGDNSLNPKLGENSSTARVLKNAKLRTIFDGQLFP